MIQTENRFISILDYFSISSEKLNTWLNLYHDTVDVPIKVKPKLATKSEFECSL